MTKVHTGGNELGWFKHRCGYTAFFTPYAAHVRPSDPENRWCSLCHIEDTDWRRMPGHKIKTQAAHWQDAVDSAARALYEANPVAIHAPSWEHLSPSRQAGYRSVAEQVLKGARAALRSAAISEILKLVIDTSYPDLAMHLYDNLSEHPDS